MRSIYHIALCILTYTSLLNAANKKCKICTKEYDPLCCRDVNGEEYSNYGCAKCALGPRVAQCVKGKCPSCVCNDKYMPVCCNGETYSNICRAKCAITQPKCVDGECKPKPTLKRGWVLGQKGATCDETCSAKDKGLVCDADIQSGVTSCPTIQKVLRLAGEKLKPCHKEGKSSAAAYIFNGQSYFLEEGHKSVCNENKIDGRQLLCYCKPRSSKAESVSDWIEGDMYDDEPVAVVHLNSIWVYLVYAFAALPFLFCICVNIYYFAQRQQRAKAAKASYAKVDILVDDEEENEKLKVNL